ncbi:MAG: hypothetical protein PHS92_04955 [Candidatus Gracilibacteria bacterium]|nr:hypothetical protein [Candidatus Gracilibacteria bacterium]
MTRTIFLDRGDMQHNPKMNLEAINLGGKLKILIGKKKQETENIIEVENTKKKNLHEYLKTGFRKLNTDEDFLEKTGLDNIMRKGNYFPYMIEDTDKDETKRTKIELYVYLDYEGRLVCFYNPFYMGDIIEGLSEVYFDIDSCEESLIKEKLEKYDIELERQLLELGLVPLGVNLKRVGDKMVKCIDMRRVLVQLFVGRPVLEASKN